MCTKDIIHSLAGTSKIVLKDVYTDGETNAIVIKVRPAKMEQCRCGLCHRKGKYYDKGQGKRRWRALDMGSQMTYIEVPVERVRCKKHGVVTAAVPWARHDITEAVNTVTLNKLYGIIYTTWHTLFRDHYIP